MAQNLKGKTFFVRTNNGVTALASELVVNERHQRDEIVRAIDPTVGRSDSALTVEIRAAVAKSTRLAVGPIFTFVNPERYAKSPWFSGSAKHLVQLIAYIEAEGGIVLEACDFYVPFSNGLESRYTSPKAMGAELEYVTTTQDFVDEFGATRAAIMGKYL
jgi:hypothetical protein